MSEEELASIQTLSSSSLANGRKIDELRKELADYRAETAVQNERGESHEKAINGNGNNGLVRDMATVKAQLGTSRQWLLTLVAGLAMLAAWAARWK